MTLGAVKVANRKTTSVAALRKQVAKELSQQLRAAFPRGSGAWLFSLDKGTVPVMRKQEAGWACEDLGGGNIQQQQQQHEGEEKKHDDGTPPRLHVTLVDDLSRPANPLLTFAVNAMQWIHHPERAAAMKLKAPVQASMATKMQKLMQCGPGGQASALLPKGGGASSSSACVLPDPALRASGPLDNCTSSTRELALSSLMAGR